LSKMISFVIFCHPETPTIQMVKERFDEVSNLIQEETKEVSERAEALRSSQYSFPLMFDIVSDLKANKVGPIPDLKTITEGIPIVETLYEFVEEGKGQSFEDIVAAVQRAIQVNAQSKTSIEKSKTKIADDVKKHLKWTETVNIDKLPATPEVDLDQKDVKEAELTQALVEQTSKAFDRAKVFASSW
jgi:hypothetical protein